MENENVNEKIEDKIMPEKIESNADKAPKTDTTASATIVTQTNESDAEAKFGIGAAKELLQSKSEHFTEFFGAYVKAVENTEKLKSELEKIKKETSASEIFNKPEYVESAANSEAVEKKVIEKYLRRLAEGGKVSMIDPVSEKTATTSFAVPKTLKEAKRICDLFIKG